MNAGNLSESHVRVLIGTSGEELPGEHRQQFTQRPHCAAFRILSVKRLILPKRPPVHRRRRDGDRQHRALICPTDRVAI